MSNVAIIVPCYNEAKRLSPNAFTAFLAKEQEADIFFIDDGSTDNTGSLLTRLAESQPERITVISMEKNQGKAHAIRKGLLFTSGLNKYDHIGYLDADLSTSLDEFYRLYQQLILNRRDYVFGSRIKMLNTKIHRSGFRHFTGRFIATVIDSKFKTGIYDTQCGAKCFTRELVILFCGQPFKTTWFFDIEILLRIKKMQPAAKGIEIPLYTWEDKKGSNISILSFPFVLKEIFSLFKNYRKS